MSCPLLGFLFAKLSVSFERRVYNKHQHCMWDVRRFQVISGDRICWALLYFITDADLHCQGMLLAINLAFLIRLIMYVMSPAVAYFCMLNYIQPAMVVRWSGLTPSCITHWFNSRWEN